MTDRGRDPRNVYRRNQDRQTLIFMAAGGWTFENGIQIEGKAKYIRDDDWRLTRLAGKYYDDDDYLGNLVTARIQASFPVFTSLTAGIGGQFDYWDETNRSGDLSGGYGDYLTTKYKAFGKLAYRFGGASVNYYIEYLHKDQERPDELQLDDQFWRVWRSKATLEVAW